MGKQIVLSGEVRAVQDKLKDGKLFMRQYKIEIESGRDDVTNVIFCDHDLDRRFEVGKMIPEVKVRPAISEYNGLHIEFHSMYKEKDNGNGAGKNTDKKGSQEVKI